MFSPKVNWTPDWCDQQPQIVCVGPQSVRLRTQRQIEENVDSKSAHVTFFMAACCIQLKIKKCALVLQPGWRFLLFLFRWDAQCWHMTEHVKHLQTVPSTPAHWSHWWTCAARTLACLPSMTATHELVVPRSMPMTAPLMASDLKQTHQRMRRPASNPDSTPRWPDCRHFKTMCSSVVLMILTHSLFWTGLWEHQAGSHSNTPVDQHTVLLDKRRLCLNQKMWLYLN